MKTNIDYKAEAMLQEERNNAMEIISIDTFANYVVANVDTIVGQKAVKEDKMVPQTLREEVGAIAKLTHMAYINDNTDKYEGSCARAEVTISLYSKAARRLLRLNSHCSSVQGTGFVKRKIDKNDNSDIKALVDAFEWSVRHFYEVSRYNSNGVS